MKSKNKLISIVMVIITLINISGISEASIADGTSMIVAAWYGNIPYSYQGEEKKAVRRSCDGQPVYTIKKNNEGGYFYTTEVEVYENEKVRNILKNGYGCKTEEELECLNMVEAFLATQEAIYIELEGRNIEDYVVDEGQGERILNATKKIIEDSAKEKSETIEVIAKEQYWQEYEQDIQYKYKEFTITAANTEAGKIELQAGENARIVDNLGNTKKEFTGKDTFYLVVPKNIEQKIKIKLSYEKDGMIVYACKKAEEPDNKYILTQEGVENIEKEINVNVIGNSKVKIINEDRETKEAIQGNVFSIIKEDASIVKENLITNEEGKIDITLDKGKYYLKQNSSIDGYNINKGLIQIDVENIEPIEISIKSTKASTEEITKIVNKEINVIEDDKNIIENNITEVSNINTTNINKEIINQTDETNWNIANNFTNTIKRKNTVYMKQENNYKNNTQEETIRNVILLGKNQTSNMTRQDYVNYVDMIMLNSTKVPILPVASK